MSANLSKSNRWKLSVHGAALDLECAVEFLQPQVERLTKPFLDGDCFGGFAPVAGSVVPYDEAEVLRRLSPTARRLNRAPEHLMEMEVYEEDERFWLVDERWGMAELNLLKGTWRSYILPQPKADPVRCAELAVLWPMAQLLRSRGMYLLPAASAVKDGWAVLLVSPFGAEPELSALVRDGWRIIGQQWTALREEEDRVALLHLPGAVERFTGPRLRSTAEPAGDWVDLCAHNPGSRQNHAFCDAVLIAEPGRRPRAHLRRAEPRNALCALRRGWPILDLHPHRRYGHLPGKLAQHCQVAEVQLSRDPRDLLALLESLRRNPGRTHSEAAEHDGEPDSDLALTPWSHVAPARSVA